MVFTAALLCGGVSQQSSPTPTPPAYPASLASIRERLIAPLVPGERFLCRPPVSRSRRRLLNKCGETTDGSVETVNIFNRNLRPLKRSPAVGVRDQSEDPEREPDRARRF